jgi:hypothetical protein
MSTQILVGGQSRINRTLCGLPLVVINCQHRWKIFSFVWFCPGIMLFMYFAYDGCFNLVRVDRQSRECTEYREPFCLKLLHIFCLWTSRACGQVVCVCIWGSIYSCLISVFSKILVHVEIPDLGVDPFQYNVIEYSPLQTTGIFSLTNSTFSLKGQLFNIFAPHMCFFTLSMFLRECR